LEGTVEGDWKTTLMKSAKVESNPGELNGGAQAQLSKLAKLCDPKDLCLSRLVLEASSHSGCARQGYRETHSIGNWNWGVCIHTPLSRERCWASRFAAMA